MNNFPFTCKPVRKDIESNTLEVEYTADGYNTILVSMPLPLQGVNIQEHMKMYAPYSEWEKSKKGLQDIELGIVITINPVNIANISSSNTNTLTVADVQNMIDNM